MIIKFEGARETRPRLLRLVVMCCALLATALTPIASAAPARPALTREVTLVSSGTGWVPVRLTAALRFAASGQPEVVRVSDPGAFAGVLLVREQAGRWPSGVGVVPLPAGGGRRYAHVFVGHERGTNDEDDPPTQFRRTLAPGPYRLFLLNRGTKRLTVTVRFPVAGGQQTLTVSRNTTFSASSALAPGIAGTAVAPTHGHSAAFPLTRRGLLLTTMWWSADARAVFRAGSCAYDGPVPDVAEAVPTCPNGPGAAVNGIDVQASPTSSLVTAYSYVARGRWLQKGYFSVAGPVRHAGVAHLWLDLGAGFPNG